MHFTPDSFNSWASKNVRFALWIMEYQACEKFGTQPKGFGIDLMKTCFIYNLMGAINAFKKLKSKR